MSPRSKVRFILLLALANATVSVLGLGYSSRNYYVGAEVVLPSVKAMAPTDSAVVMRAATPHIASTDGGKAIEGILRSQLEEREMLHREWVRHAELRQELLWNQMLLWMAALVTSVGMACIHLPRTRHEL